jgi:hypothetical protein
MEPDRYDWTLLVREEVVAASSSDTREVWR